MNSQGRKRAWLSLGSNIEAESHICAGIHALRKHYGNLQISPVYESQSVGFAGDNFLNLVVGIETGESIDELNRVLKDIEDENGRLRAGDKFSSRTLDIDLLTYGDEDLTEQAVNIPRHEILLYAFVLRPLSDIAPDELHPHLQMSYKRLWDGFDQDSQPMQRYEMDFD